MKKIYIFSFVAVAWLGFSVLEVISNTMNPPLGKTGAPNEGLCTDCHGGQPNTGLADVSFTLGTNGDNKYFNEVGASDNRIDLTIASSGKRKFGFELTALDKNKNMVGHFWAPNNLVDSGFYNNRYYGFHDGTNGSVFPNVGGGQWTIMWHCPTNYVDPVYFYTAFNETNESGDEMGDRIYTRRDTAFCDPTMAIKLAKQNPVAFNAFVTANQKLQVVFEPEKSTKVLVDLYNMNGQKVKTLVNQQLNPGATEKTIDMPANIPAGVYLVNCEANGTRVVRKVVIN